MRHFCHFVCNMRARHKWPALRETEKKSNLIAFLAVFNRSLIIFALVNGYFVLPWNTRALNIFPWFNKCAINELSRALIKFRSIWLFFGCNETWSKHPKSDFNLCEIWIWYLEGEVGASTHNKKRIHFRLSTYQNFFFSCSTAASQRNCFQVREKFFLPSLQALCLIIPHMSRHNKVML